VRLKYDDMVSFASINLVACLTIHCYTLVAASLLIFPFLIHVFAQGDLVGMDIR